MKGIQLSMLATVKPYPLENRSFEAGEWLQGQTPNGQPVAGQYAGLSDGLVKLTNGKAITPESAQRFDLTDIGDRLQIIKHRFDDRKAQAKARYTPEHRFAVDDLAQEQQAPHTPEHSFHVGDRVRVVRGCCKDLESVVTVINPDLKHSIQLEPGKGRFPPGMLQKLPPEYSFQAGDRLHAEDHPPLPLCPLPSAPCPLPSPHTPHPTPHTPYPLPSTPYPLPSPHTPHPTPHTPSPPRRHSPRGQASGWIEERQGNRKRKSPSTSYYYGWQDQGGKYKRYIPAAKVYRVQQMIAERKTVAQILSFLDPHP